MDIKTIIGKSIALIIWNTEDEDDVRVCCGELKLESTNCFFVNEELGWKVSLDDEQLSRLTPVADDLKEVLSNAEYSISLTMGNLPDDESGYIPTGMNWSDDAST